MITNIFQIAGTLETLQSSNLFSSQAYANTPNRAKVEGSYKWVLLFSTWGNRFIWNIPSLIFSRTGTYNLLDNSPEENPLFVINKGKNLPYNLKPSDNSQQSIQEVLQEFTWQPVSLTGVILNDWSSQSGSLVDILGVPKDTIGFEYLGSQYLLQVAWISSWNTDAPTFTKIDFWRNHVCGLTPSWWVQCWGSNSDWQLWDGTTTWRNELAYVSWLESWVIDITSWVHYSCAALSTGWVKCWWANWYWNLWDNSTTDRNTPVDVLWITNAIQISAWDSHACATLSSGGIQCWGQNSDWRLWDGSTNQRNIPVNVIWISNATQVSAGYQHTCAILSTGWIQCWGNSGSNGTLWNGDTSVWESSTPINVVNFDSDTAVQLSAGYHHTCATLSTGNIKCWWRWNLGQLWYWTDEWFPNYKTSPISVVGISNALQVSTSEFISCATLSTGEARCWWRWSSNQLWNGTSTDANTPVAIIWVTNANSISIWQHDTCISLKDWWVQCWGQNFSWHIWDGTSTNTPSHIQFK